MRSFSQTMLLCFPALLAALLMAVSGVPLQLFGMSLTPNIAWLSTLVVASLYPPAWQVVIAFAIGLWQDMVFATPLGAQALLSVLLVLLLRGPLAHRQRQPFRLRWLEAGALLLLLHGALWLLMAVVQPTSPALKPMLRAGLVSALWYPMFYGVLARVLSALPPIGVRR